MGRLFSRTRTSKVVPGIALAHSLLLDEVRPFLVQTPQRHRIVPEVVEQQWGGTAPFGRLVWIRVEGSYGTPLQ